MDPAAGGVMGMDSSSKEMLKTSFIQGGLAHGTHKAAKPSGKQQTHHSRIDVVIDYQWHCLKEALTEALPGTASISSRSGFGGN
ncbi:hypothetical protein U0070_011107 [Myodes glareolus]|uniref:Uncharacterized protein n=1 Tax=Myodes glareolus TaxID=447135 RepID=A0AAW0IEL0_MYOGA